MSNYIVSPLQGFVDRLGISAVSCTDGYCCNALSVLYYDNNICIEPQRGDILVATCVSSWKKIQYPHRLKPQRSDILR